MIIILVLGRDNLLFFKEQWQECHLSVYHWMLQGPVGWNEEEWAPSFNRNPQTWNAPFKTEGTTELNVMALAGFSIYMLASIRDLNHIKCSSSCSAKYCKKQIPTSSTWIQDVSPLNNPDQYNTFLLESKNRNITFDSISKTAETNDAYHYFPLSANLSMHIITHQMHKTEGQARAFSEPPLITREVWAWIIVNLSGNS